MTLHVPARTAPLEQRQAAYDQLAAISYHETHTTMLMKGVPVGADRTVDYLQLQSGVRVYEPEDLVPAVLASSPIHKAIKDYDSELLTRNIVLGTGIGFGVIALGCIIGGAASIQPSDPLAPDASVNSTPFTVVGVGAGLLGAAGIMIPVAFVFDGDDPKATAFELYPRALLERLDLSPGPEPRQKVAGGVKVSAEPAEGKPGAPADTPTGAAGFKFASSVHDAAAACTDSGAEWTEAGNGKYECSGTAADLGMPASTRLGFRDGKLHTIAVVVAAKRAGDLVRSLGSLKEALVKKYGAPKDTDREVPDACDGEELGACLFGGQAHLTFKWRWTDGAKVDLGAGKEEGEAPGVTVRYTEAKDRPKLDAL
ncbi:MAG: hypothetical protein IT373_20325 [Polyangiaceae bacterium]|nr:hypothetical protein [Polyangiaceae bacterium]